MEDKNKNKLDDDLERKVEIVLTFLGMGTGIVGLFTGFIDGKLSLGFIVTSFALYQGTSLVKIIKEIK
jgi:hypothetical protein